MVRNSLFALLTLTAAGGDLREARGTDAAVRENELKAAYLFNFVKFVDWPASAADEALTVCFIGGKGVYDALADGIEAKRVGTRHLAMRVLEKTTSVQGCNVLYVEAAVEPDPSRVANVAELPILTISDTKDFALNGGMIAMFTESNRLRFSINVGNAQKAGLRISSSLLQLAASVERGGRS